VDLFLDPTLKGAKTSELFEQLREAIVSGRLAAEGYIEGRAGAGSYVSPGLSAETRSSEQPAALEPVVQAPSSASEWALSGFEDTPRSRGLHLALRRVSSPGR
jgi:hypothetical protein